MSNLVDAKVESLSFWHSSYPAPCQESPRLDEDLEVDVAIVGAGFTGLWTAYYLKTLDPSLSICLLEANFPGFGASGRNGGWAVGEMAGMGVRLSDENLRESAIRLQYAMFETVDEMARVIEKEAIDCHWAKGGQINLATTPAHEGKLRAEVQHWASLGFGEEDFRWLDPGEAEQLVRPRRNHGALFSPHCAAIHPLRLVAGLAATLEGLGVSIYSNTPVQSIQAGRVRTPEANVKAGLVVGATEAYTDSLAGRKREMLPYHSLMIATEPIPAALWEEIGLDERQTFGDPRRTVIYGQRTLDGRMAFGARGGYRFGSGIRTRFSRDEPIFEGVRHSLDDIFPALAGVGTAQVWGGALGIPRNWMPSVGIDRKAAFAWAGGYVGEGVAASNLAGRTLADLILKRESPLVDLAWVGPHFTPWEPEPLRWLGVKAFDFLGEKLDLREFAGKRVPRLLDGLYDRIVNK
ncbi:MAG: FAD-binding oxidoreductase [Myxococcota bacterium]|nr:FAD-binding oxidoreductase [Myxococcota bacterium]